MEETQQKRDGENRQAICEKAKEFNDLCLENFKMPWLLNREMRINGNLSIMVNAYKLASASNFFWQLLSEAKREDPLIVTCSDLNALEVALLFSHEGIVSFSNDNIDLLFRVAMNYQMPELLSKCENFVFSSLSESNCLSLKSLAMRWHNNNLNNKVDKYVLKHFISIAEKSEDFLHIPADYFLSIIKDDSLNIKDEYNLFKVACKWVTYDLENRLVLIPLIIDALRLGLLSYEDDINMIQSHPFVQLYMKQCEKMLTFGRRLINRSRRGLQRLSDYEMCKPRQAHACLVVFGGGMFCAPYRRLKVYDNRRGAWNISDRKYSAPTGRMFFESIVYKEDLYMVGGLSERFIPTATVYRFSFTKHSWGPSQPMQESRFFLCLCVLSEHLYAIGGLSDNWVTTRTVERYSVSESAWEYVAPLLTRRNRAACSVLKDRIYICGGLSGNLQHSSDHWSRTCEVYDPLSNQWTFIEHLPDNVWGCYRLVSYTDCLYLIQSRQIHRYDVEENIWSSIETRNMQEHFSFTVALLDGEIYRLCDWTIEKWSPGQSDWLCVKSPHTNLGWGHQCAVIEGIEKVNFFLNKR